MLSMTASPWLYSFLKNYEQFRPTAYAATADERARGIWTIGWGHTEGVKEGDTCTTQQAELWLENDSAGDIQIINHQVKVPLTQEQFDALCSMAFNVGTSFLYNSTLAIMLNSKNYAGAADQILRWNKQNGVEVAGLSTRRIAERRHFLGLDISHAPINIT